MGRGRVEMKKIENRVNRQVTFSKRRRGLLKKAHELAVLCDAELGVIIFSESGKLFEYSNPPCSMSNLIHQYGITTDAQLQKAYQNDKQMQAEMARLTNEKEKLESNLRISMGEGLSALSLDDLSDLEQHLQSVLSKVRARKHELQTQMLNDLRRKTDETGGLEMEGKAPSTPSGSPFPMEPLPDSSTLLQLWPQSDSSAGGSGSSSPRGATTSCRTGASLSCGLQLW